MAGTSNGQSTPISDSDNSNSQGCNWAFQGNGLACRCSVFIRAWR
ncbi:hypothetical protein WG66_014102 [Moniliophthora roreri]|nr:hypothetical protein WG66_014102 [Moniliophthora roreri]